MNLIFLAVASLCAEPLTPDVTMSSSLSHSSHPVAQYKEVPDTSGLKFLNPDLKTRQVGKIHLPNGLDVLLISDPAADQSSASMAVMAGSWSDPEEYPGMAHFCEHMLFMGTGKFPDNEFSKRVSDAGGVMNAFTATDRTVYMFSSKQEDYLHILDRFAHFFIDPLFDPENISRELHAVDQEFAKNLEHDGWREYMVFKEMSREGHPNQKFSTGNAETLGHIPSSALHDWHKQYYGADGMKLFLYSNLPLETMKEQATALFSAVPPLEAPIKIAHQPILSDEQKGQITYIVPIQNKQTLTITWELPPALSDETTKGADLIAYVLNRGQQHNLYEVLKREQMIDSVSIRADDLGSRENGAFSIELELSPKGIAHYKDVVQRCYEALAVLKKNGIPSYLFDERNKIAKLGYEYQSRQDAFQMARSVGQSLPDEALTTYPKNLILGSHYDPEIVQKILAELTPEKGAIVLAASPSLTQVAPEKKEKWFGVHYAVQPISTELIAAWKQALPNRSIRIPEANPFLPSNLENVAANPAESNPILVSESEGGIAYYARAPEFSAPETAIGLYIRSPALELNAKTMVLVSLYLDHLTDELTPITKAARSAGLSSTFDFDKGKLSLSIYGFSEKAPLLLRQILKNLNLAAPTRAQFDLYVARHEKTFENGSKELPFRQAREYLDSVLLNNRSTKTECLAALKKITYEEYVEFQDKLYDKTYTEALFAGNLTLKDAESSWIDIQHILSKGIYPKREHLQAKVLDLPSVGGPFVLEQTTEVQGNATVLAIDEGQFSLEKRSAQDIVTPVLREAFFNELRTKQKTGYITGAEPSELEDRLFHYFIVQSNSHQPEDLLYRFELFLEEYLQTLPQNVSVDRFEALKGASIHSLKTRYRNLRDKASLWTLLAFEKGGDFNYITKRIEALEALPYNQFLKIITQMLSRQNTKRLAVLYEGRLPTPFTYVPVDASRLLELGHYVAKGEKKEPNP